jgi:hypothetical protein
MSDNHLSILTEVVNLFVQKNRQGRFIELLSKPKRYEDALSDLLHSPRYLDERIIAEIPSNEHTPKLIYARLKKLGVQKQCIVISSDIYELNGKTLPTLEALEAVCYNTDSMLFCPVSKIGYYEGHEGWRYILNSRK